MSGITWTAELDAKVVDGIARGLSRSQIAAELGADFTRNMVIARHARIRGIVFQSDTDRHGAARDRHAAFLAAREIFVAEELANIDRRLKLGLRRNHVIACARIAGLYLEEIGARFGVSKERIRQICDAEGVPSMRAAA